jgi:integrase
MKRGNITKRGKNSWQLKFDVPAVDGRRQQRYATVRGSRQDAQRELTRLLGAADAGALPDPTAMTVADYVRQWLASAHEQAPRTLERYGELAANQIIPHLGGTRLQKLNPEAIRQWHGTLLHQGLSPRTVGHAHRLLRLVLAYAVKSGVLVRNAATVHSAPRVEQEEIEILSPDQIAAVRAALTGSSLLPIVDLATGMRRGELLGLQWGDIDLDAATLRVERSLEETKAGLRLKSPKTKRGRRNIRLPAQAVTMLRAHRLEQMELRLALGMGKLEGSTPVFSNVEGQLLRPRNVTKSWSRMASRLGLSVSFHALRHTHVSMLIREGVDILAISRRIGHSKAATTLDVYGHLMSGADEAAAKAIEGALK